MTFRSTRGLAVLGVVLLTGGVLAACGGSSPSSTTSSSSSSSTAPAPAVAGGAANFAARRTQLEACLKRYHVSLPAFAGGAGGGFRRFGATGATGRRFFGATGATGRRFFGATGATGRFPVPAAGGAFASNPKLAAALAKCGGGFGGFAGGGRFGASGGAGAFNPTSTAERTAITAYAACMKTHHVDLPTPNFSGGAPVFGTKVNRSAAAFVAANATCKSLLGSLASGSAS